METITITVEGGVIQMIDNIPEGVRVVVQDFDTEGTPPDELTKLESGDFCIQSAWR